MDWSGLGHNALWVIGLAIGLAAVSEAHGEARLRGARLRDALAEPRFQGMAHLGLALFCLGVLFSAGAWWERVVWAALALAFGVQVAWAWWAAPRTRA